MLALIRRLGFIQVDSINTVERAHHMILWLRRQPYRRKARRLLHERDRAVFEHWTHDASIVRWSSCRTGASASPVTPSASAAATGSGRTRSSKMSSGVRRAFELADEIDHVVRPAVRMNWRPFRPNTQA